MSTITGIGSRTNYYEQIASGKKLQRASDGAAKLAIVEKQKGQANGYDVGTRNAQDGKSALNVADGGMSGIADSLQRMRELALKASNSALLSNDELRSIQDEIDQLKQGIASIADQTEFNTKKLLDGSNTDMYIASGANGEGHTLDTGNATLQALGIENFDVTKRNFNIQTIDDALNMVSSTRSSIGAQTNALDFTINYNTQASYNLTNAYSRMEDTDIEKAVTEMDKQKLLESYRTLMQKKQMEQEHNKLTTFHM